MDDNTDQNNQMVKSVLTVYILSSVTGIER